MSEKFSAAMKTADAIGSSESAAGSHRRKRHRNPGPTNPGSRHSNPKRRRTTGVGDGIRQWVYTPRDLSSLKDRFTVVSYNILGVDNASKHSDLYHKVAPKHLSWEKRKKRIHKELRHYKPSILCFQEVDRFDDLADLLGKDGYIGTYKRRTGEARDGCAIFWKEEKFTLLQQEDIEFRQFGLRDNVALLCAFKVSHDHSNCNDARSQTAESQCRTLIVGNIHMLFNPNRGDIKLGQIRVFLEKAKVLSQGYKNSSLVISGDFNSMPQSAIYQFLTSSELDILAYDRKKISGQIELPVRQLPSSAQSDNSRTPKSMANHLRYKWTAEEIRLAAGTWGCTSIQNHLKLSSAYRGIPQGNHDTRDNNGEPLATSYHSKFMGTVDYIWHSSALAPVGVVDTLPLNILKRLGGLPSKKWASDHLSLVCEFGFVNDANCIDDSSCSL
ncbi:carbon catabolite repressor protein 4 homolog 5-like isoform X3 [Typha angustifolia]|uniref:carbon catabolite repressor protein 4 homolog 5-like isoform X3 n=1 Tax=Typha angustifolia TaxID=59011 RepID=UPI003C2E6B52